MICKDCPTLLTKGKRCKGRCLKCYDRFRGAEKAQKYRNANPEKVRAATQRWREENRERTREYARERYRAAPETANQKTREWYQKNKEYARAKMREYATGWTPENFEYQWTMQEGKCALCGVQMLRGGCSGSSVAADHDHVKKKPRGLLCNACNRALGYFEKRIRHKFAVFEEYLARFETES
jgi:hypothetical protein